MLTTAPMKRRPTPPGEMLLEEFLKQPHQEVSELRAVINGHTVPIGDFSRLPTRCKFIAFMPQWDFLNFISVKAKQFPNFQLLMEHAVVDLIFENERVAAHGDDGGFVLSGHRVSFQGVGW